MKTVRVCHTNAHTTLMTDAKKKGRGGIILAEVPLQVPDRLATSPHGIQVDVAVLREHAATIREVYRVAEFTPFTDEDPIVQSQLGGTNNKRPLAIESAYHNYMAAYTKTRQLAQVMEYQVPELVEYWSQERLE